MIRKNRYPSKLWQYFVRGEDTAKCNLCKKVFSFKSSLSNLKKHLMRKHPTVEILRGSNTAASNKILLTEENLNDISQISFKKIRLTGRSAEPETSASGEKLNSGTNRKRTSIVWKYFSDDNGVVTCNLCKNIFKYNTSSSSNLKKHLFRKHPIVNTVEATDILADDEFDVVEENSDNVNVENMINIDQEMTVFYPSENVNTDVSCTQEKVSKFTGKKFSPSAKKIEDLLLDLFILDFQPFSIVEDRGFRKLMKVVSPMYTLPTRKIITKTLLPTKYEECLIKIKKELSDVKVSSVILTIDSWTSMNTESFMAVTCHFINSNFLLESKLLECFSFSQSSTSSDLAAVLERIANDWGLENKISFCISDGSSNVKTAVKDILKWNQFDCYGRTINSIANDGLELPNVSSVIRKIKSVIQHFKMCADSAKMLSDFQENLGSTPKKLLSDVSLVWNSTFYMLERFVELEEPISSVLAQIDKDLPVLDSKEWKIAAELVEVLQPLEEITKIMSEEVYLTASSVIIMTKGMESAYVEMLDNSLLPETQEVVESITLGIRCHLGDLENSDSLLITTFLDPRFKTVGFSSPSTAEKAKKLVIDMLTKPEFRLMESNEKQKESTTSGDEKSVRKRHSAVWNLFDKQAAEFKPAVINNSGAVIEVQRYLEEPLLSRNEDPIKWWQENSYNYPILKTFFIEKFVALATSVPCERLFSKTGVIFSDRRSRLSSDSVKKLVFLNANQQ